MIVFRIICAFLLAWAVNWSLSRPEALQMIQELPELAIYSLLSALAVGYFNLAVRQGWGVIVAFANGVWAGVLAIFLAGTIHMCVELVRGLRSGVVKSFENFLTLFGEAVEPLLDQLTNLQLLIVSLGATAVVGVVTEILHWLLVRLRQGKPKPRSTP
ncbi:MAG: hypothetical protein AAGH68_11630 [Pseudomonadota bacterium]